MANDGNLNKRSITNIIEISAVASAATPEVQFAVNGMYNFSITVATSATSTLGYTIYTSPFEDGGLQQQVTSTSVLGTATGAFTVNTFTDNNNNFCKVAFDGISQTGGHIAGTIKVYLTYNER